MSNEVYRLMKSTRPLRHGDAVMVETVEDTRIDTSDSPSIEEGSRFPGQIFPGTAVESDEMPDWRGTTSSNVDATPREISLADMEEAFSRIDAINHNAPPMLMAIYMSPEDYSLLSRALERRIGNPSSSLCELHGIPIETNNYLAPGVIYLKYREGGEGAALQDLGGLLRNKQAEPQKTGTFTEPGSAPPPNEDAKPFTDDDFDRLIADIEDLTNE